MNKDKGNYDSLSSTRKLKSRSFQCKFHKERETYTHTYQEHTHQSAIYTGIAYDI
jgi:hypothetical protein